VGLDLGPEACHPVTWHGVSLHTMPIALRSSPGLLTFEMVLARSALGYTLRPPPAAARFSQLDLQAADGRRVPDARIRSVAMNRLPSARSLPNPFPDRIILKSPNRPRAAMRKPTQAVDARL
jgi:hypothetical protein